GTGSRLSAVAPLGLLVDAEHPAAVATARTTQDVTPTRPAGEVVLTRPPPPVRVATQTVTPGLGYVWTPGYWRWTGTDYVWVSGNWVIPPRTTTVWVPGQWVRRPSGWVWIPGHWR